MALAALEIASGAVVCPKCECADFRVYRTTQGQSAKFRYKACRHCGHKIITKSETQERIVRDVDSRSLLDDLE